MTMKIKQWEVKPGFTYLGVERDTGVRNHRNYKGAGDRFDATEEEIGWEKYKLIEIKPPPPAPPPSPPEPSAESSEPPSERPKRKPGRPRKVKSENTAILYPPQTTFAPDD